MESEVALPKEGDSVKASWDFSSDGKFSNLEGGNSTSSGLTSTTQTTNNLTKTNLVDQGYDSASASSEDQMIAKQQETAVIMEHVQPIKITEDTLSIASSLQGDMCRICHSQDGNQGGEDRLINPCQCCGTLKYVHQSCLQMWVKSSDTKKCELCGYQFNMTSTVKPFTKWKKMDMTTVERRKVLCSVTFHVAAITCVIWSLYVLIDKTTQEIQDGNLNWPFWTKLVVVAIGFTGGLVFMYVQCKMYVQLFRKWKQYNRVIYIKNVQVSYRSRDGVDGNSFECKRNVISEGCPGAAAV